MESLLFVYITGLYIYLTAYFKQEKLIHSFPSLKLISRSSKDDDSHSIHAEKLQKGSKSCNPTEEYVRIQSASYFRVLPPLCSQRSFMPTSMRAGFLFSKEFSPFNQWPIKKEHDSIQKSQHEEMNLFVPSVRACFKHVLLTKIACLTA